MMENHPTYQEAKKLLQEDEKAFWGISKEKWWFLSESDFLNYFLDFVSVKSEKQYQEYVKKFFETLKINGVFDEPHKINFSRLCETFYKQAFDCKNFERGVFLNKFFKIMPFDFQPLILNAKNVTLLNSIYISDQNENKKWYTVTEMMQAGLLNGDNDKKIIFNRMAQNYPEETLEFFINHLDFFKQHQNDIDQELLIKRASFFENGSRYLLDFIETLQAENKNQQLFISFKKKLMYTLLENAHNIYDLFYFLTTNEPHDYRNRNFYTISQSLKYMTGTELGKGLIDRPLGKKEVYHDKKSLEQIEYIVLQQPLSVVLEFASYLQHTKRAHLINDDMPQLNALILKHQLNEELGVIQPLKPSQVKRRI